MAYQKELSDFVCEASVERFGSVLPRLSAARASGLRSDRKATLSELAPFLGVDEGDGFAQGLDYLANAPQPSSLAGPGFASDGTLVLGSTGYVRIPRAGTGFSFRSPGAQGEIETKERNNRGAVAYDGNLKDETGEADGSYWVQVWNLVIPFPCAPVLSDLSFTLSILASVGVVFTANAGFLSADISHGLTPNFAGSPDIEVNTFDGSAVQHDLTRETFEGDSSYNGFFGRIVGRKNITGGVRVSAGNVAALAVSMAIVVNVRDGDTGLRFGLNSRFEPGSVDGILGTCLYRFVPVPVLAPI